MKRLIVGVVIFCVNFAAVAGPNCRKCNDAYLEFIEESLSKLWDIETFTVENTAILMKEMDKANDEIKELKSRLDNLEKEQKKQKNII
jgi:hypothetical protein